MDLTTFWSAVDIIEGRDDAKLELLLQSHPSLVDCKDRFGETLLMKSIQLKNTVAVRILLKYGSPIDEVDNNQFTALHHAVSKNLPGIVKLLLDHGANINKKTFKSKTPLLLAVNTNSHIVNILLSRQVRLESKSERIRQQLLIGAVKLNQIRLLKKLLKLDEFMEQIDGADGDGRTALIHASKLGYWKIVDMLLKNNASMYLRDKSGRDAYYTAAEYGHHDVICIFIFYDYEEHEDNLTELYGLEYPTAIFAAVMRKRPNLNLIYELLDNSTELVIHYTDRRGNTLLHLAIDFDLPILAVALVERGLNKEIINLDGIMPLDIAVNRKQLHYGILLVDVTNLNSESQLLEQIRLKNIKNIKAFLECGVQVSKKHIEAAIDGSDESLSDYNNDELSFRNQLCNTILGILIESITDIATTHILIDHAMCYAVISDKFMVVHQLFDAGFGTGIFGPIPSTGHPFHSFEMQKFIKKFITTTFVNGVYYFTFNYEISEFFKMSFPEFLFEFAKWRVKHGTIDNLFDYSRNALKLAIEHKREDIATVLLQHGIKPFLNIKCINNLSEDFVNLLNESEGNGLLTLQGAARISARTNYEYFNSAWQITAWRKLLQFRSKTYDINSADEFNRTALHFAIMRYETDVAKMLISEGCNPNLLKSDKYESIDKGPDYFANDELIALFRDSVDWNNPLFPAIKNKDYGELLRLIKNENMDINGFYNERWNALHYAITFGDLLTIALLLQLGSLDLPTQDRHQFCGILFAYRLKRFEVEEYLRLRGFKNVVVAYQNWADIRDLENFMQRSNLPKISNQGKSVFKPWIKILILICDMFYNTITERLSEMCITEAIFMIQYHTTNLLI